MLPADVVYSRTEIELDDFERASFQAMRRSIPDYYTDGRDDTLRGRILRSAARLMAKGDFQTQYLLAGLDPACLTPADLLRQFGPLLRLNRNYPGTAQYDLDFKAMILKLLQAYRLGSTAESIRLVLEAYTGTSFTLEELFTSSDISDHNAIRIGLGVSGGVKGITGEVVQSLVKVQDVVKDLYTAIDLAKPAHIGINLTTVLRDDAERISLDIRDTLRITALFEEAEPGSPLLYEAPFMDPKTPRTGLGPESMEFSYQWFRDGVAIPQATSPDYIFTATLADTQSRYSVRVSHTSLGQCWSGAAVLTVSPQGTSPVPRAQGLIPATVAPTGSLRVVSQPSSRSVVEGAQVVLSVSARNDTVPGILSPHLNRCWEISGDTLIGMDYD